MKPVTLWSAALTVTAGLAYLASHHFLAGWTFAFFGLLYCISGVGPLVDRWDAQRLRREK